MVLGRRFVVDVIGQCGKTKKQETKRPLPVLGFRFLCPDCSDPPSGPPFRTRFRPSHLVFVFFFTCLGACSGPAAATPLPIAPSEGKRDSMGQRSAFPITKNPLARFRTKCLKRKGVCAIKPRFLCHRAAHIGLIIHGPTGIMPLTATPASLLSDPSFLTPRPPPPPRRRRPPAAGSPSPPSQ